MRTVKINKVKLLEIIKTNRLVHIEEFKEAMIKYREASIAEMKANLKQAQKGGSIEHHIGTSMPTSYEDSYNSVISMLELTEDEMIELNTQEFSQYVEDKWGWRGSFEMVNSSYGVAGAKGPRGSAGLSGALGAI